MTAVWWWVAVALLVAAAVTAGWPAGPVLRRLRDPQPTRQWSWPSVTIRLERPRRSIALGAAAASGVGLLLGGPVAAVVGAVYAAIAIRAVLRRARRRLAAAARARSLDNLCALAADLRAGLPPTTVMSSSSALSTAGSRSGSATSSTSTASHPGTGTSSAPGPESGKPATDPRIAELTDAVWRLAERTGAPAADLVERIEADARAADRARASAEAQSAGAQATAMLLAALPLGGIALGFSIGVNPVQILLHTTLGAACAIGAVLLQCAGLLWADRLVTGPAR